MAFNKYRNADAVIAVIQEFRQHLLYIPMHEGELGLITQIRRNTILI